MITAAEFQKKYSKFATIEGENLKELQDSKVDQNWCMKMLAHVLEVDEISRRRFLLGVGYHNCFGIGGEVSKNACRTVYETVLFYLQHGWWIISFDKAKMVLDGGNTCLSIEYKQKRKGEITQVFTYVADDKVIATTINNGNMPFHYTVCFLRSPRVAFDMIQQMDASIFDFDYGMELEFEVARMIGDSFTSVDHLQLFEVIEK